jgi:polar amino acid transport system substrate-binding protein
MIIWIYILSGMSFYHAILSSAIIYLIAILVPYNVYKDQLNPFILHTMWMSISMIFGFFGAYLMKKSQKENFLKQLELEKMAIEDKLTGLYNRTKLDEVLAHELKRASRYKESIGVFIIDIDFFKSVNDVYGHLIGDKIIVEISKLLKKNLRSTDTLFRWGGEEFIILSLDTHEEEAINIAKKINKCIKETEFDIVGHKTVSIGVTTNNKNDDITSIIKRADEALYLAKNCGRDCVKYK